MIKFLKKHYFWLIIFALASYFLLKASYFVLHVKFGIPPDEGEHYQQIMNYFNSSSFFLSHENLDATYGTLNQSRFFYHMFMGKLLHLNFFGIENYMFLRGLNVVFSLGYLVMFYKLLKLFFKEKKWLILTTFAIQTNIIMFTFLSASINYDNLVNLLAIGSIYFVLKHIQSGEIKSLLIAGICVCLGMLTKISFGPLMVILFLILVVHHRKDAMIFFKAIIVFIKKKKRNHIIILGLFIATLSANVILYSSNYVQYDAFFPKCHQMYSMEECLEESDNYAIYNVAPQAEFTPMKPYEYFKTWSNLMLERTFGIFAHQTIQPEKQAMSTVRTLLAIFFIFFVLQIRKRKKPLDIAILVALSYTLFLAFEVNYKGYLFNGIYHAGVQGRYIFPVLPLIVMIFTYYMMALFGKRSRVIVGIVLAIMFIYMAFPSYYFHENRDSFEARIQLMKTQPTIDKTAVVSLRYLTTLS
ncbi:DUF2142 domain-containing protein [Candidatus Peregrinibacteria bacterium]|jgi:hypothetical protein|nr:DUF2142 domain-containing protein [Candidatus Peregrinibacteria bacterium]